MYMEINAEKNKKTVDTSSAFLFWDPKIQSPDRIQPIKGKNNTNIGKFILSF